MTSQEVVDSASSTMEETEMNEEMTNLSLEAPSDADKDGTSASLAAEPSSSSPSPTSTPAPEETATPPPRLMITNMELENFKSYAGIKQIGPFHKSFTSIVGPNGSGKSNVIDAMLFVFGKRAKKLRLNKVSDLIHSSEAYKDNPLPYARVSVYFQEIIDTGDGDNDYTVVPNTGIIVERRANRNNSSQYRLDGKNCSFRDVATFLSSKGIDLDNNRFLILQGEVELISMMAPKGKTENDEGLLEYLEDIIGSNKYVEDTNTAAAKVELLSDQRQEKLNRVKAVEKEKDSLEGAKFEAEALLAKEREIRRKKNILVQIQKHGIEKEMNVIVEKKEEYQKRLEEEEKKLETTNKRLAEIEKGHSTQTSEYEKAHAELVKTKEEFSVFERNDIKLREDIKHEKANKKKLEAKVKKETKKEENIIEKVKNAEESIPELEEAIAELGEKKENEDAKLEKIFEETKVETENLRQRLEKKTQELAPVSQERAVFQATLDTAETEVKLLEDSTSRAKEQLAAAEQELASLDSDQEAKRTQLASYEDELTKAKQRMIDGKDDDVRLLEKEKVLAKRNRDLMVQAEEAKASLQSLGSRSDAVNGILKAASDGKELSKVGILGRLGDLASIKEEYDVAISTACAMLDHIVVQTTAGAQRCLDFLRKHKLGRANFIPLDKMKKGIHDRKVDTPEGAPRLFDLIETNNFSIVPALYLGVANTLVAPDLETATRWAYEYGKRWRVVTIDGNLIELSGTMQGGGKTVRRGGMRLMNSNASSTSASAETVPGTISENDCKKLELAATGALEDLKKCKMQRRALAEELRETKKRIKTLSVQIPKLSMEIDGFDTTRNELTKRIPELRQQSIMSDSDKVKLRELTENVKKCKDNMAACASLASKLEGEVGELQKAILNAGGPRLKKQQKACDKVVSDLNSKTKELNSAKVIISTSKKNISKAQNALKATSQDLEKSVELLTELKESLKQIEQDAFEVMEQYEKVKKIEEEQKKELQDVASEFEELKGTLSEFECSKIELVSKIDSFNKQIKDSQKRIKHLDAERMKLCTAEDEAEGDEEDDIIIRNNDDMEAEAETGVDEGERMDDDDEESHSSNTDSEDKESSTSLPVLPAHIIEQYDRSEVKDELSLLEEERKSMAKNANMTAIQEYRKKERDYLARASELDEVSQARNEARKAFDELRRLRLEKFMDGFSIITLKLKEMYQMITLGGDAELELVDSLDPFSEGIVFSVRPPKKSWKNISNLSGGEKTLSSLALVFALHHYKPTPLYVMDEIDAALDFKNVSIVANYIKERTKDAQFIIISLRNNMFELADRLVGIYKTNNCTKSITIDPKAFSVEANQTARTDRSRSSRGSSHSSLQGGKETQEDGTAMNIVCAGSS